MNNLENRIKSYLIANSKKVKINSKDIKKGDRITEEMLTCKRPGTGLYPELMDMVIGSVAKIDIKEDTVITRELI